MNLYLEGHNPKLGYIVARQWNDAECANLPPATPQELEPVRYFEGRRKAEAFIARYNRMFATH